MRKISQTPFAGKKVRESRTPKTNPKDDPYEQDRRAHICFDHISSRVFLPGPPKDEHEDSNGIAE
ncbi:MAG: hypothetical protein ABSH41_17255, partial [Syntrophobacteraceae bacterium]|jgi:hypothetical protein